MKNLQITLLIIGTLLASASAQTPKLIVQGESGKLCLEHTVVGGENWYSIGRLYNISPREIAPYNGLTIDKPLSIAQHLKVPLKAVNFVQNSNSTPSGSESLVPVYHIIQEKEWLYHISAVYNKVSIEKLEKWNHINGDQVKPGLPLIIGWLKVKSALSSLATSGKDISVTASTTLVTKTETKPGNFKTLPDTPIAKTAPLYRPTTKSTVGSPSITENKMVNSYTSNHGIGGYFGVEFKDEGKITTGLAATFKSTSGWQDGKYYALMNNVPIGTIVRVTNSTTSKNIYAKVLGQLPDMKESAGLTIRISNAAASEMGSVEVRFPVEVRY